MFYWEHHLTSSVNPQTEWRFIARQITYFYGPFSRQSCLITGGYQVGTPRQFNIAVENQHF